MFFVISWWYPELFLTQMQIMGYHKTKAIKWAEANGARPEELTKLQESKALL